MTIKKFLGSTREEAIANAKQELGDEVVIMNVKEVRQGGVLGVFRRSNVEVTAAVEDGSDTNTVLSSDPIPGANRTSESELVSERKALLRERQNPYSPPESLREKKAVSTVNPDQGGSSFMPGQSLARPFEGRRLDVSADEQIPISETSSQGVFKNTTEEDLRSAFTEISEVLNTTAPLPQASTYDRNASLVRYNDPIEAKDYSLGETRELPHIVRESFRTSPETPPGSALETLSKGHGTSQEVYNKQVSPGRQRFSTADVPRTEKRSRSEYEQERIALSDTRSYAMSKIHSIEGISEENRAAAGGVIRMLYNTLLNNDVDERYVNDVLNDIDNFIAYDGNLDGLISNVYQKMVLKLGKSETIKLNQKHSTVVFFIGPTGVGKTTTIAKLASQFKLDQKKDVALLSADTYRIAAEQQLSTYADRLNMPLDIMYPTEDINEKLNQFKNYDLIFVDTAGFSHNNVNQREDMRRMLNNVSRTQLREIYLVLSATTKYRDLKDIVDTYKDITDFNIVFTKLDETSTYGNLLNIRIYSGAPLSYVTDGQDVPSDIDILDAQKLVRQLLEVQ